MSQPSIYFLMMILLLHEIIFIINHYIYQFCQLSLIPIAYFSFYILETYAFFWSFEPIIVPITKLSPQTT